MVETCKTLLPLFLDIFVAFGYLAYLFNAYVGLILASTYIFYGIIAYKLTPWMIKMRQRYRATHRIERNVYYESIASWMPAFNLNRQDYQQHRVEESTRQELREARHYYNLGQVLSILQRLVIFVSYGALLFRAAYLVTETDQRVGDFITLLLFHYSFAAPLFKIAHTYNMLVEVCVDAERQLEIAGTRPTVTDVEDAQDLIFKGGKVEFRDINLSYDGVNQVIKELGFDVSPGKTVAFVDQSGSGETTTCDKLLFRGYDVTGGAILVDGQDVRHIIQRSLRETIDIVRQEQCFYNDTVVEIVRYARPDATDQEVVEACKNAAVHDQIISFPKGHDSTIGERGVKFSGGERQRLAIAQLFLRDPMIIVLGEATASADNVIESEIHDSLARICKGRTTLMIKHRLSTIHHAGEIFVLDKGTMVERGIQLLNPGGIYTLLWNK
ncbi:P-loop containing nucleoside triphosphate hydrolase protein, partial [Byssothecium circinans]